MSLENKIVWYEGMFLSPQHFQQQERYIERVIDSKCQALGAYSWGFQSLEIDQQLLTLGKVSLNSASGIFPDGTPFNFPNVDDAPPVIDIPANTHNEIVYLGIPVKRSGSQDVTLDDNYKGLARYFSYEHDICDVTKDAGDNKSLEVGKLRIKILLESDDKSGFVILGILKVSESRDDGNVLLDNVFIPTSIDSTVSLKLHGFITELIGLLHHRAEAIVGRLADVNRAGTAEVADYLLLQLINKVEPYFIHLSQINGLHPEVLYRSLIKLAGELSTFMSVNKRPPIFPAYVHDDLQATFQPIIVTLRDSLTMVYEQSAISLQLIEKKYGIYVAQLSDRSLVETSIFILAVRANVKTETMHTAFAAQLKIASVEHIRQLVNAGMPGIAIKALPVAPRQIPFHSGFTYFELDRQSSLWNELQRSGGIAIHIGGEFPGLELELWAIRE